MRKFILILILLSTLLESSAQFVFDDMQVADGFYAKGDYYSAVKYYEKFIYTDDRAGNEFKPYAIQVKRRQKDRDFTDYGNAVFKCAESYRKLTWYVKAVILYRRLVDNQNDRFPLAKFYLAYCEKMLSQFPEATAHYADFIKTYKTQDEFRKLAQKELKNLEFIQAQFTRKDLYQFSTNSVVINPVDTGASYGILVLKNDSVLFNSTRPMQGKMRYSNRIYLGNIHGDSIVDVARWEISQPEETHQTVSAISPDSNRIFMTRWSNRDGKKQASIWVTKRSEGKWMEPEPLLSLNEEGYSSQQPAFMKAGKDQYLLFASDRPGGRGGFDLYAVLVDAQGNLGLPKNLGASVNTPGDELAPFYHQSSGTLVYAAGDRIGMGGLDLYFSKGSLGKWDEAVNAGYPVNSVKDDIYFSSRGPARNMLEDAWVGSDRSSACCLQVIHVQRRLPKIKLSGKVTTCEGTLPVKDARVSFVDTISRRQLYAVVTDQDGRYTLEMDTFAVMKATVSLQDHYNSIFLVSKPEEGQFDIYQKDVCLTEIKVEKPIVLNRVYFEFDKADLTPESSQQLDSLSVLMADNPGLQIEVSAHTDSKGSDAYNLKLSNDRAAAIRNYLLAKGIEGSRVTSKGYGETMPLEPNTHPDGSDNPEGRAKNRRCSFTVVKKWELN